jgi:cation transport regulator ChaB
MPKTTRSGKPKQSELPDTIARSGAKAQRTFAKAHDAAAEQYGEGERAHRVAYAALKHTHEKVGDHWEPKASPGPSDARATGNRRARTAEGVDARASKAHLYDVASRLEIRGRSRMTKTQLVEAIAKENRARTRAS